MRPKLVLFGDSITEMAFQNSGWSSSLANHFSRKVDVVSRGYSGYNTRWALKVIDKVFDGISAGDPVVAVTVFFGANDACLVDRSSSFQHVPVTEYKSNLMAIVSFIKEKWPKSVVILITPPPIDVDGRIRHPYGDNTSGFPERTNEAAGAYAHACKSVALECELSVIDLWSKMQEYPDWGKTFLSDGLHLTADGNRVVFEEVILKLQDKGLSIDTIPIDLPYFPDINPMDPLKAFQEL